MSVTLVLGGARSGKSRFAEREARRLSPEPIYLATSRPWDEAHQKRIARHRADRGPEWTTVEQPLELSALRMTGRVVVVDCVTLWLTNYFCDLEQDVDVCLKAAQCEFDRAIELDNTWLFVSNELGQGLHAATEAGRKFTDLQGFMNQFIAARADRVVLLVAGIPLQIKNEAPKP